MFLELGHFDKHSPTTGERKVPQWKNLRFFRLETLKNCILNETFYPLMTTIRAFFLHIRALFSNFRKRARETSPLPPLVTRLLRPDFKSTFLKNARKSASVYFKVNIKIRIERKTRGKEDEVHFQKFSS